MFVWLVPTARSLALMASDVAAVAALASSTPPLLTLTSASTFTERSTHFRVTLLHSGISLVKRVQRHPRRSLLEAAHAGGVPHAHTQGRRQNTCREATVEGEKVPASAVRTANRGQNARLHARLSLLGRRLGHSDWIGCRSVAKFLTNPNANDVGHTDKGMLIKSTENAHTTL